ncbi:RNA-directed DNA polymerase protein [Dioscorea alata]|uniref:RNA-directed DNA polymerase protein n=1 Tax=Dioscorea alata TaxID=55571 RepID=A0ACB7WQE6_DIOAL|nr:RNA-directed DNA polymerase protein [Dioscorea alata]
MNLVTWNVRGLGRPAKRFLVKDLLHINFADVCCLQESKLDSVSALIWREIGGSRLDDFAYLPSQGSAGGIIIGWNSSLFSGKVALRGTFSLTIDFYSKVDNRHWRCTSVYGPNARSLKRLFWEEIRASKGGTNIQWVICGDFNAIFSTDDKHSDVHNFEDIRCANDLMQDLCLLEPPAIGRKFTWTNGQADPIWVKLDRFLVNHLWANAYPRMTQKSLPRLGSDHVPIRLEVGLHSSTPRFLRYELAWSTVEGFHDLVINWWRGMAPDGCGAFVLTKKVAGLRGHLRQWAKECFGSIKLRKVALLHDIDNWDILKETRTLTPDEARQEFVAIEELGKIRLQEEIYWKQRSRLQWLKDGDENTKYFHAIANGRKNRNFIPSISDGFRMASDPREIGNMFSRHFMQQFGQKRSYRFKIDLHKIFCYKANVDLSHLERPFSLDEIKRAVFDLGGNKAP